MITFAAQKESIMKYLIALAAALFSVGGATAQDAHYGEKISAEGALSMAELQEKMKSAETLEAKVEGTVLECCQTKGCWMKIDAGDGQTMRVRFKDYGFFVPKNSAGKTAVLRGVASMETTSVADLRHYAEDAGKSREEIEKITEPKRQLVFMADGVILKD
jgi:hypothetical protein